MMKLAGTLTAIATLCILSTIFLVPLNSDSDLYQAMAVDLVRYGKLPYMGSWDQNFPGIVYVHAASVSLFGNSDIGFRIIDVLANLGAAYALYTLTSRIASEETSLLAPFIYSLYYVSGGWWAIGQRDVFACCFLLVGAALFVSGRPRSDGWRYALVGLSIGAAAIIRPTYAVALLPVLLFVRGARSRLMIVLGFLAPGLLFLFGYLAGGGELGEVMLAVFTYNTQAYGAISETWSALFERTTFQWLILAGAILGFIVYPRSHADRRSIHTLLFGAAAGLISLLVMRKFFVYHFHVFFVLLIPVSLFALDLAISRIRSVNVRHAAIAVVLAIAAWAFYPRHLLAIAAKAEGSIAEKIQAVQSQHSIDSSFGRSVDLRLAHYLGSEKQVELVSVTPAVHWMNELDRPSRFTMIHPLTITDELGQLTDFQIHWRQEYLDALEEQKPRIIVLADGPAFLMRYIRGTPRELALGIAGENGRHGFVQLLEQSYVLDTTIGGYYIYTRNVQ